MHEYTRLASSSSNPVKIRARTLFSLYDQLLEKLGDDAKFTTPNTLCKRLKQDFPLFRACMKRDSTGAYFLTQAQAQEQEQRKGQLETTAEKLDMQYSFEPTLFHFQVMEGTWSITVINGDDKNKGTGAHEDADDEYC